MFFVFADVTGQDFLNVFYWLMKLVGLLLFSLFTPLGGPIAWVVVLFLWGLIIRKPPPVLLFIFIGASWVLVLVMVYGHTSGATVLDSLLQGAFKNPFVPGVTITDLLGGLFNVNFGGSNGGSITPATTPSNGSGLDK